MPAQPKIGIVGGSLVGPFAQLALRAQGFKHVEVFEAMPTPHSQSGGVMGVRWNTLDTLDTEARIGRDSIVALRDPDVHAFDLDKAGVPELRGTSPFPGMITSWDALHRELADRSDVRYKHTITDVRHEDGREVLTCKCGTEHDFDLVIWADGRKSLGRTLTDPDRPLKYNGYVVWRGLTTPPAQPPHGFHRYYDIEGGRLFSLTEPIVQSGLSYWEFSHNLSRAEYVAIAGGEPEDRAFLLPQTVARNPLARRTILEHADGLPHSFADIVERSEISGIPVNDLPLPEHALTRHQGGGLSVLLGDAIVPVRLQVGAGLNQGIHQASDLAAALASPFGDDALECWDYNVLADLARYVEQGRSRAHRTNLGWYLPVRMGRTTAPTGTQWDDPQWVTA
jgi:2-polyprenyl-6-methoxyphenol hydroxylase-like FAD-dependent oxidoreductase